MTDADRDPLPAADAALAAEEVTALAGAAQLFGELLLFELDAERLAHLQSPELAGALAALGVEVPDIELGTAAGQSALDALAAEFYAALLAPRGGAPPVRALWEEGRSEGRAAERLADLALLAGFDHDAAAARGAPLDHLGAILLLWGAAAATHPAVADIVATEHLPWAVRPLQRLAGGAGFYGAVARAALELTATLTATRLTS